MNTKILLEASPFHEGEQFVQKIADVREDSEETGKQIIRSFMPDQHRLFFTSQGASPILFASSIDDQGRPWASLIFGKDFVTTPDNRSLKLKTNPIKGDPLQKNLKNVFTIDHIDLTFQGSYIGLLGIEFATRRRNRVNGRVQLFDGGFTVNVDQSFGNCPKYIQARNWSWNEARYSDFQRETSTAPIKYSTLNADLQQLIRHADTFFVATAFLDSKDATGVRQSAYGCDVSHRGGRPGFVQVLDDKTLKWPDYLGNFMFNTLGNIQKYSKTGLLFMDFVTGDLVQLTGNAVILYDDKSMPGSQRMVLFAVDEVLYFKQVVPLDWQFVDASPFNPEVSVNTGAPSNQFGLDSVIIKCREIVQETFNIKTYKLSAGLVMAHLPGQYATFELEINGKKYTRTWTISSMPESPNWSISITVKKKQGGIISNWLFDNMAVGMSMKLLGISGDFTLSKAKDSKVLMIAGGVGVTPMLSMLRFIAHKKIPQDVILLWSVSTPKDLLPSLDPSLFPSNVKILPTITQPSKDWNGLSGRIGKEMIATQVKDLHERKVFLCGPELFMQSVEKALGQLEFPAQDLYTEKFDF